VGEQDPQVRGPRQGVRIDLGFAGTHAARVRTGDPDQAAAELQRLARVEQQAGGLELPQGRRLRLRVARDRVVVVAEHGEHRLGQLLDERAKPRLAARPGQQVAGDADEIRTQLGRPRHAPRDGTAARRRHAQVEVREVGDPQPVELARQPGYRKLEPAQPDPARLEEAPPEQGSEQGSGAAPEGGRAGFRPSMS
jgi:hypothetical protein